MFSTGSHKEYKIYVDLLLKPLSVEALRHHLQQHSGRRALELGLEQFLNALRQLAEQGFCWEIVEMQWTLWFLIYLIINPFQPL